MRDERNPHGCLLPLRSKTAETSAVAVIPASWKLTLMAGTAIALMCSPGLADDRMVGNGMADAGPAALAFYCLAKEDNAIPVIKSILDKHLVKFAWREELDYEWISGVPDDRAALLIGEDFLPEAEGKPD
jgi:hypothetical protein